MIIAFIYALCSFVGVVALRSQRPSQLGLRRVSLTPDCRGLKIGILNFDGLAELGEVKMLTLHNKRRNSHFTDTERSTRERVFAVELFMYNSCDNTAVNSTL